MTNRDKYEASKLLYIWLSKLGRRSLESIKTSCDYLSESYHLSVSNPIWELFWPMVFSGVIDHTGKGYYALTEPLILDYHTHFYYINNRPIGCKIEEVSIGIYVSDKLVNEHKLREITVEPKVILKKYPSVDKIIDGFSKSLQDEKELRYYNRKNMKGIAELEKDGLKRFFSIPEKVYMRELPDRTINPDAFALAYCYGRVINKESNGTYYLDQKQLVTPSFALPFMLYRVLQLETMTSRHFPKIKGDVYIFDGVSMGVVKELNRIFCNSIRYE